MPSQATLCIFRASSKLCGKQSADIVDTDHPTRLVLVPSFIKTGVVALVCLETLEVRTIGFEAPSWDVEASEDM